MLRASKVLLSVLAVLVLAASSHAWTLDFENGVGHDYETISSGIPGLQFTTTDGYDWIYGDANSNGWNVRNQYGETWNQANYWITDYGFASLGPAQGSGRIDFTNKDGSFFATEYCAFSNFYVEAYDINDNLIDQAVGGANLYYANGNTTGPGYLSVSSASNNIAYIMLHDTGNFWLVDNMSGNATGVTPPGSVPEPATMFLMGLGLVGTGIVRRIRK